jgi:hypothetical protein
MDSSSIMWGVLFGSIGMGYLIYGKKQQRGVAFFSGIALCAFPYFISNIFLMLLMGAVFMALPYFIRF